MPYSKHEFKHMFIYARPRSSATMFLPIAFRGLFVATLVAAISRAQIGSYPLESANGLRLSNVSVQPALLEGKRGLRVAASEEALRDVQAKVQRMTPQEIATFQFDQLAVVENLQFSTGTIEAEIAGEPAPGAGGDARGFVGIAFRVRDMRTYDAFYLRPTNGRSEDQERRNHSVQYISHPEWPWSRLRRETPSKYESYVDLVPGAWTTVRIEVHGNQARLYVHDRGQPTLIINDVKSGAQGKGAIALWVGAGAIGYFRNLSVRQ